jgi:hypothetical protein
VPVSAQIREGAASRSMHYAPTADHSLLRMPVRRPRLARLDHVGRREFLGLQIDGWRLIRAEILDRLPEPRELSDDRFCLAASDGW